VQPSEGLRCHNRKSLMKHLLKFAIFILFVTACHKENKNTNINSSAHCFQTILLKTNFSENLQSIYFINGKDGFVAGSHGGIYKTTDSAKTWTALNSTTTLPIRDIYFLDNFKGFAVGGENSCSGTGCIPAGGFILETSNGGQTWSTVFTPSDKVEISSIYFVNKTTGFCAGDNVIMKTVDGGLTWVEYKINDLVGKMMKISFADSQNGYVVCSYDKIIKTKMVDLPGKLQVPTKIMGTILFLAQMARYTFQDKAK
jgi:photosystem II stability/assembly factor-like uncharacterized protein